MKKKSVSLVAALILMLVAIPTGTTGVAFAHSGHTIYSSWTTTPPVIDGNITTFPGEWADATQFTIVNFPGTSPNATGYVKNDGSKLYMAAVVPDVSLDLWGFPGDGFGAFFDTGHDGVLTVNKEDGMAQAPGLFSGWPPPHFGVDYLDLFWLGVVHMPPFPPIGIEPLFGGVKNGLGECTYDGVNWYYEFEKPLNSRDSFDLATSPGQTVGLAVISWEFTGGSNNLWPPAGQDLTDANTWGDLVLASDPSPPPSGGGGGGGGFCFIATAAYGSYLDSHVETLRDFRDQYLETNPVGSALVSTYYELSPPVAEFIDDHPALKPMVRAGLMPAVALSTVAVNTTLAEKIAMGSALALVSLALGIWLRRRAVRKMTY